MSDPPSRPLDVKAVWQGQTQEIPPMVLENVRADALKFRRRTQIATVREMVACVVVIVAFGFYIRFLPGLLMKLGSTLGIVWALFYMWNWRRLVTAPRVPDDASESVGFYRQELVRRRDVARGTWSWVFAPLLPIIALFVIGRWIGPTPAGRSAAADHLVIAVAAAFMLETLAMMWLWILHRADKCQDRIDELDALRGAGR